MNKGKKWKPVTLAVVTGTVLVLGILGHAAFGGKSEATTGAQPYQLPEILGLEDANTYVPADNPLTAKKVELGRLLFFDKRLSKNNTVACVSCHLPGRKDGLNRRRQTERHAKRTHLGEPGVWTIAVLGRSRRHARRSIHRSVREPRRAWLPQP